MGVAAGSSEQFAASGDARSQSGLPFTVPSAKGRFAIYSWLSLGMAAIALVMLLAGEAQDGTDTVMMVAAVLFFGGGGLWMRRKAPTFDKVLSADHDGVTVYTYSNNIGPVAWDEIREFRLTKVAGVSGLSLKALGIELQDPERTMARFGKWQSLNTIASEFLDTTPIGVPKQLIAAPIHPLIDRLNAILKEKTGR